MGPDGGNASYAQLKMKMGIPSLISDIAAFKTANAAVSSDPSTGLSTFCDWYGITFGASDNGEGGDREEKEEENRGTALLEPFTENSKGRRKSKSTQSLESTQYSEAYKSLSLQPIWDACEPYSTTEIQKPLFQANKGTTSAFWYSI